MGVTIITTSCQKNEEVVVPTADLTAMHFTYEPGEGEITLKWEAPADPQNAGFMYMKLIYTDPRDQITRTRTISPYTNKIIIPNTRARYGNAYHFTFVPYSITDTPGKEFILENCSSNPAPITSTITERAKLKLKELSTNAQEPSEGPLANLTNGNTSDFFHSNWSNSGVAEKHWVDIDLGEEVERFEIHTWNRTGGTAAPSTVELYRLTRLNDAMPEAPFYTYTHPNGASGAESSILYPQQEDPAMQQPVRYLRYCGIRSTKYWNMAEMEIYKVHVSLYNPETDEPEAQ